MSRRTDNRGEVERGAKLEKAARRGELDAVRFLMSTPLGRGLAWRQVQVTGCDRAIPFRPNAMDLAHDVGVRAMGEWLLAEVRAACPEQEMVMRSEAIQRDKRAELEEESQDDS